MCPPQAYRITGLHGLAYKDCPKAEIYAACDVNRDTAGKRAGKWGAKRWFADCREMLADPMIDAVEIITHHDHHSEMTIAALEAGKHVSVQEPMVLKIAGQKLNLITPTTGRSTAKEIPPAVIFILPDTSIEPSLSYQEKTG